MLDSADSLLAGLGSDTDWIANNGGGANPYVMNQSGADALDNGLVTAAPNAAGGSTATYTPPSWFSQIVSGALSLAPLVTTVAPLINGQPQGSGGVSPG